MHTPSSFSELFRSVRTICLPFKLYVSCAGPAGVIGPGEATPVRDLCQTPSGAIIACLPSLPRYDSTLDFDDAVPDEVSIWASICTCTLMSSGVLEVDEDGFYETFGPVFRRNARWSTRRDSDCECLRLRAIQWSLDERTGRFGKRSVSTDVEGLLSTFIYNSFHTPPGPVKDHCGPTTSKFREHSGSIGFLRGY